MDAKFLMIWSGFLVAMDGPGDRAGRLARVHHWLDLGRRAVAGTAERLIRRRCERDKSRLALADIDESDLSEFGRRVRVEVLRERRDRELRKRGNRRPVPLRPVSDSLRALGYRIATVFETIAAWHLRARMRAELMALDDRTLKDIGLARADVLMESDHSFWKGADSDDRRARWDRGGPTRHRRGYADPRWNRPTIATMSAMMALRSKFLGL